MSKSDGEKIVIEFTEMLVGDVSGNVEAFSITGQQLLHRGGSLINGDYEIASLSGHIPTLIEIDLSDGTLIDVVSTSSKLTLGYA